MVLHQYALHFSFQIPCCQPMNNVCCFYGFRKLLMTNHKMQQKLNRVFHSYKERSTNLSQLWIIQSDVLGSSFCNLLVHELAFSFCTPYFPCMMCQMHEKCFEKNTLTSFEFWWNYMDLSSSLKTYSNLHWNIKNAHLNPNFNFSLKNGEKNMTIHFKFNNIKCSTYFVIKCML